jgi:hypothetical protein
MNQVQMEIDVEDEVDIGSPDKCSSMTGICDGSQSACLAAATG